MANLGRRNIYFNNNQNIFTFYWKIKSQSTTDNTSTIAWEMRYSGSDYFTSGRDGYYTVIFEGSSVQTGLATILPNVTSQVLATGEVVLEHNEFGQRDIEYSFYQSFALRTNSGNYVGDVKGSGDATLMPIGAQITTIEPTVTDVYSRTLELTGDNNTFIKYYSIARYYFNETARKGTTIGARSLTCGSFSKENLGVNNGVINGVDSNTFYFSVIDTGGAVVRKAVVVPFIPYVKLTAAVTSTPLTANGDITFTVKGKYYQGSFGAKNNSMELEYSVRDSAGNFVFNSSGSGWVKLGAVTPTVDSENNYEYSYTVTGLDYSQQYEITVNVIDELSPVQTSTTAILAIPAFDWSGDDFHHHTKVTFADNIILEERKTVRGLASDGSNLQLLGLNASDNLSVGWGGYNSGQQDTLIYGTNVEVLTKEKIKINGNTLADYVIEQGTNGTWFYRKWNSGRVDLSGYQNISSLDCTTALGGWYRTAVQTAPSFPFTVYNPKTVLNYVSSGTGALVWCTTLESNTKPANYYLIRPTSSSAISGVVNFYTIGTWK